MECKDVRAIYTLSRLFYKPSNHIIGGNFFKLAIYFYATVETLLWTTITIS